MPFLILAAALLLPLLWSLFAYARWCRDWDRLSDMAHECEGFDYGAWVHEEAMEEQGLSFEGETCESAEFPIFIYTGARRIGTFFDY